VAFKAEELTTKIFPMLAAGGCPQDTVSKGKPPCPQNTHVPCPDNSRHPCGGGTQNCPQDTAPTTHPGGDRKSVAGLADLALLRTQLQERLARA
jgi:hypothetical protein